MQADRIAAVDRNGNELSVGDRVRYLDDLGLDSHAPVKVLEIGEKVHRVGKQFGGYEFRSVRLHAYGWVNPTGRLEKVDAG